MISDIVAFVVVMATFAIGIGLPLWAAVRLDRMANEKLQRAIDETRNRRLS